MNHEPVPEGLGQNRGSRNTGNLGIAADNRFLGERKGDFLVPVNQNIRRPHAQGAHGPAHGNKRSAQNIDGFDFPRPGQTQGPGKGMLSDEGF
jgi:hypothetical protein